GPLRAGRTEPDGAAPHGDAGHLGRDAPRARRAGPLRHQPRRRALKAMDALDLDTPAVYVDLDALEGNIARMQELSRRWGVSLRPHTKTHKIPEIASMQLAAGASGITVAKIGEAEVLPGDDVLVAYPVMAE